MTGMVDYLPCPFCGEDDFDAVGLKHHLIMGYCVEFNETEAIGEQPHTETTTVNNGDSNGT